MSNKPLLLQVKCGKEFFEVTGKLADWGITFTVTNVYDLMISAMDHFIIEVKHPKDIKNVPAALERTPAWFAKAFE